MGDRPRRRSAPRVPRRRRPGAHEHGCRRCRELSLSVVYVAGVAYMAWIGSFRVGLLGAIVAAGAVLADGIVNSVGAGTAIANAVTAFAMLIATVAVVDRLRKARV